MVILDVSRTPIDVALRSVRNLQSEVSTLLCIAQEGVSVEASRLVGAGAAAVLGLDTALPEVVAAVRSVLNGRAPMSLERRYRLEQILREHLADEQRRWLPFGELTERERTIFALVYDGMSADQIAERECVSVHTVRSHIRQILAKLNVNSQLAAVALARSHGWFAPVAGA
jgi:DNA-binding NarL/FixJ family response regulator